MASVSAAARLGDNRRPIGINVAGHQETLKKIAAPARFAPAAAVERRLAIAAQLEPPEWPKPEQVTIIWIHAEDCPDGSNSAVDLSLKKQF
jgi:hypothetical protein